MATRTSAVLTLAFLSFSSVIALHYLTSGARASAPAKAYGFVYSDHAVDSDTIKIEAFFDPLCPDSADAWAPLKEALDYYGTREKDKEVVFKAMGRAINKTVTIVELIKRRIPGVHQVTTIGSIDITDTWEPLEEGLVTLETTRHVSMITISLSKKELDLSSIGYQPPIPAELVKSSLDIYHDGGLPNERGRGRGGRGRPWGRGNGYVHTEYDDGGWDRDQKQGYSRGRGRGSGRGFRGRGRDGPPVDMHQDGVYNQEPPPPGRGRGRGRGMRGRGRGYRSNGPSQAPAGTASLNSSKGTV